MKIVSIRDIHIGEGVPKIIVPLMGRNEEQLLLEIKTIKQAAPDIVEWRADMLEEIENLEVVKKTASTIRDALFPIPLLFTFRSHREGGNKIIDDAYYQKLLENVMRTKAIDLIDVELFSSNVSGIVEAAHANGIYVVMSNHDFEKTPPKEEIVWRLRRMQDLGAHIPKIAVMPKIPTDVLTLLDATYTMKTLHADRPIITMSMASTGVVSRIAGQVFGSDATFGSGMEASAPGQIPAGELRKMIGVLHTT
ncbi:type I 3-dehydroquinate dehydratase [Psychrobacillus lasiicapitis]|uniref:3-dehydroquinate dehydratase n=1 Tax=Psychrobacillus lasiicapitis TaxID=1636719 RepID=A0A544T517_9BACI|nr:type I 3-dehydroquinate dehydratase [Psychrobacillus lasiicapitis]TQR12544.1 type I 3-dehydroquinate dehydratase [Psychrobacillus lasiicapitis]GGA38986.1 3-dehydroquinate dehydratase [Psychrobacillus lasiicapitis]